jgi:hypothetical protein
MLPDDQRPKSYLRLRALFYQRLPSAEAPPIPLPRANPGRRPETEVLPNHCLSSFLPPPYLDCKLPAYSTPLNAGLSIVNANPTFRYRPCRYINTTHTTIPDGPRRSPPTRGAIGAQSYSSSRPTALHSRRRRGDTERRATHFAAGLRPTEESRPQPQAVLRGRYIGLRSTSYSTPRYSNTALNDLLLTHLSAGENSRRPPRPRQDPLSDLQPAVRKVHRFLARTLPCPARHLPRRRPTRSLPRPLRDAPAHLSLRGHQIPRLRAISRDNHTG